MELNLYAMKTLVEVANRGSFSKAAQALFLTQPAVSLQIKSLENYFRTVLLLRGPNRKIALTREGKILCDYARRILEIEKDLFRKLDLPVTKPFLQVSLGVCVIAGEHFFPPIIKQFLASELDIHVSMSVLKCKRIFEGLQSMVFEIGITGVAPPHKHMNAEEILRVAVTVFESGAGGGAVRTVSLQELAERPLIIREEGSGIRTEFLQFLKSNNLRPQMFRLTSSSESNEAIKAVVKSGGAFSMLPGFMVEEEIRRGELRELRLREGEMEQRFFLVCRKKRTLSPAAKCFHEFIRTNAHFAPKAGAALSTRPLAN